MRLLGTVALLGASLHGVAAWGSMSSIPNIHDSFKMASSCKVPRAPLLTDLTYQVWVILRLRT